MPRLTAFLLLVALLPIAPAAGQSTPMPQQIDTLFAEWDRPDSPGAALAVMRDGEIFYEKGYGMANLDYDVRFVKQ